MQIALLSVSLEAMKWISLCGRH